MMKESKSVRLLKDFERYEQNLLDKMQYDSDLIQSDSDSYISFQSEDKDDF